MVPSSLRNVAMDTYRGPKCRFRSTFHGRVGHRYSLGNKHVTIKHMERERMRGATIWAAGVGGGWRGAWHS